jgi:hypothetical protein
MNAIDGERDMGEDSIMLEDFVILEALVHSKQRLIYKELNETLNASCFDSQRIHI